MRRPVKPFVTEYRGGTRRQGPGGSAPKPDFSNIDMDQPLDQPQAMARAEPRPALSARHAEAQEDSYEAAMRAADALFAARRPAAAATTEPSEAFADAPHAGGRVLRVLDEAPSPEMLRLEAEHAPKRRGRKPGSKNKPKVAPIVTRAPIEAGAAPAADDWGDEDREDEVWTDGDEAVAAPAPAGLPMAAALRPMPARTRAVAFDATRTAAPAGDKYAWVRTKLKPGQQWKRRLPKVAW